MLKNFKEAVNKEMHIFGMICHATFDQLPLTMAELVKNVKKRDCFTQYGEQARKVLGVLLNKYADKGTGNMKILQVNPLTKFGSLPEIINLFDGRKQYFQSITKIEQEIYKAA